MTIPRALTRWLAGLASGLLFGGAIGPARSRPMTMQHLLFVVMFSLAPCVSSRADEPRPLTVQTAIALASTNNPELRVLEVRIETARRTAGVAKAYPFNPEFIYDEGLERHFGVSQTLEWPGKRALREAIANQDIPAAQAALDGFRVVLAAEVRAKFYEILAARKGVELRERERQLAERVLNAARKRVEGAFAPVTERTSAEVGLVRARRQSRAAQKRFALALAELNVLLGCDAQTPIEPQGELTAPQMEVSLSTLIETALARHPDLRAARLDLEKRGLSVRLARKAGAPDITIQPFYEQDTKGPDDKVGIGLTVPLPIWNTSRPKLAAAQAELQEAEADLEKKLRKIAANIAKAFTAWEAARADLAAFSPELQRRMETELAAAEQKYAGGELPFLLWLELQRTYFDYMNEYYQSLAAARDTQSELEKASAVSLEELK